MDFLSAYKQMKENKSFVRRVCWHENTFIWLKDSCDILETWCKDENLKKVIHKFGNKNKDDVKTIKAEAVLCIYQLDAVHTGFKPTVADINAKDWEIINL